MIFKPSILLRILSLIIFLICALLVIIIIRHKAHVFVSVYAIFMFMSITYFILFTVLYDWRKSHIIQNFTNWTSGNEIIDKFIREKQIKINKPLDIVFEWIPYNQFNDIKKE